MTNQWDTEASLLLELPRIQASLIRYDHFASETFGIQDSDSFDTFRRLSHCTDVGQLINIITDDWGFNDQSPAVWFEDDVTQNDFDRIVYQLVYLAQSEPFIIAMLGLYVPIIRSKYLAHHDKPFQNRMLWTFKDEVEGFQHWQDCDLFLLKDEHFFDWREARNNLPPERIAEYLKFAGLPPLEDANVPPAWVFRNLCSDSVANTSTDEELRAELYWLYEEQDRKKQLASKLSVDYTQPNLFGWKSSQEKVDDSLSDQLNLLGPEGKPTVSEADVHDLDQLFQRSVEYKQSANYLELLNFINQQKNYAPYNAFLMHTQHPDMTHAETAYDWKEKYDRDIRPNARPLVILIPFGPVNFVYDIEDTVGPPLPVDLTEPFRATGELPSKTYDILHANCARMDVAIQKVELKNNLAGNIRAEDYGYTIKINETHSKEVQFATLVHELAHLLCGHLGARPKKDKWQDRRGLTHKQIELEAESASYLVCKRLGIKSEAEAYLSGYISEHETVGEMSLHHVLTVAGKIISMCERLLPQKKS
ncbi:ImmA/IrrE family metallo-endopeptidase [Endozoicomonas gorgoniicola]|uniref:ImmA/IrrE family metallo-endopeptidase n=1 Tax=Endozoicomonas gorgoniicola TaxID=1234144 RepID=A0ABT3MTP1_9GAMM|nr:ImmA/IrrE family metallo-endopeptidase [Endozoicomonas gorgoniicola]MCW7552757.1 ImmA/IrrE family metallo-endopeptidase [Endozoicomonas gorgoniicola]